VIVGERTRAGIKTKLLREAFQRVGDFEDMAPHLAVVESKKAEAVSLKDRLAVLRKTNADASKLDACRADIASADKAARDAQAKADAIDAAVYDLKAVNPRAEP
jgi:type I restriction enzyme M protein